MLVLLAAGLAANVLLGPLEFGGLVWRVSPDGRKQTYGADAAMLPLVVPAALGTALAPITPALTACTIALLRTDARGGQRAGAARSGGDRTRAVGGDTPTPESALRWL